MVISQIKLTELKYYKEKCRLLENIEKENPCDPDIYASQIEAYSEYHSFLKTFIYD